MRRRWAVCSVENRDGHTHVLGRHWRRSAAERELAWWHSFVAGSLREKMTRYVLKDLREMTAERSSAGIPRE